MTQQQLSIDAMQGALAKWKPNALEEREERHIIRVIEINCMKIGVGPLSWLAQNIGTEKQQNVVSESLTVSDELLACPNCKERRFLTMKQIHGHMRVCKKTEGE